MTPPSVRVDLGPRSYDIAITSDDAPGLGPFARQRAPRGRQAFVVTDANAAPHARRAADALARAGFAAKLEVLEPGESRKSLAAAAELYDRLADWPADRQTLVVAVGGGVVGDLAGFVAATYARGLPLLMVPTTLLAMVDSSVGGKVGVNHPRAKNLIGAFHQPVGVWIDTATLATLPPREYRSGLAEVVKYGAALDGEFFDYLEAHAETLTHRHPLTVGYVVARCCRLKADVVERDEREETGVRVVLNYGHTFAHAFESVGGYGSWLHGEAVAAGMVCASRLSERRGLVSAEATGRQRRLLERFGLPVEPRPEWEADELLASMRRDKKNQGGRLRLVLLQRVGAVAAADDVTDDEVVAALHPV
jgi:3-dehydroquinate synthase